MSSINGDDDPSGGSMGVSGSSALGIGGGGGGGGGLGVSRQRVAGLASTRNLLSLFTMVYVAFLALALVMLLCLNVPSTDFWNQWYFWRYFFSVLGMLTVIFAIDIISRSCLTCGSSQPHIGGIVFTSIHIVWCLVITGFMIDDFVNCATRPWCAAPSGGTSTYFLLHAIGFWGALLFEVLIVFGSWRLYSAFLSACPRACGMPTPLGLEFMGMHMSGARAPVTVQRHDVEHKGLLLSDHDVEALNDIALKTQ